MQQTKINNQQKKACMNNLKDSLDKANISIDVKKSEHPTGILTMTLHKPAGEPNPYVQFKYIPQKIYKHAQGQVSI